MSTDSYASLTITKVSKVSQSVSQSVIYLSILSFIQSVSLSLYSFFQSVIHLLIYLFIHSFSQLLSPSAMSKNITLPISKPKNQFKIKNKNTYSHHLTFQWYGIQGRRMVFSPPLPPPLPLMVCCWVLASHQATEQSPRSEALIHCAAACRVL